MRALARERLRALAIVLLVFAGMGVALGIDARARASSSIAPRESNARIARATGLSDLALSTSSGWLRHPGLAAPSAGAADSPLGLDVDPAGAMIARHAHERTITIEVAP